MEIEEKDGRKKTGVRLINEEFSSQKVKEENEEGT